MPFARTQTTVATGYAAAVTVAPRSVRARQPTPTQSAAARASPLVALTAMLPRRRMTKVELQFLSQHPIELVVAEAAIGRDAHTDVGGQFFRDFRTPSGVRNSSREENGRSGVPGGNK
jgi:hypothetical protein